jgi:ABC-type glycerol-3-phosphate transport system permease component
MNARTKRNIGTALTYLFLAICAALAFFPITWVLMSSLKTNKEIADSPFLFPAEPQWVNYREAWIRGRFGLAMGNSAIVAVSSTLFVLVLASLAAYAFAKMRFKGNRLLFFLFFFGMTIPNPIVIGPLLTMVYTTRIVDTLWSLILPYTAAHLPLGILMMRAFFRGLPDELIEAGRMDGCSNLQLLSLIVLPLALPAVFVLIVLNFLNSWREFYFAVILISDSAKNTLPLGLRAFQGAFVTNFALQFTGIIIAAVVPIAIYVFFQKSFIRGATAGSLKS